jgi:hypothetical protein
MPRTRQSGDDNHVRALQHLNVLQTQVMLRCEKKNCAAREQMPGDSFSDFSSNVNDSLLIPSEWPTAIVALPFWPNGRTILPVKIGNILK